MQTIIVRLLRWIVWGTGIFFLLLFSFVEVIILVRIFTGGYLQRDVPVYLKTVDGLPKFEAHSPVIQFNKIAGAEALMKLDLKMTSWTAPIVLIGFTVFAVLTLGVVRHLLNILRSLRRGAAFDQRNIRRLRLISISLVVIAILELADSLFNRYLLNEYAGDAQALYIAKIEFGLFPIILAMVVFLLSEIFRQGHHLQTENEAFI